MPPDLRSAATGDIDSTMLQTSTNRLLLQSWLPDGGSTHSLAQKKPAHGTLMLLEIEYGCEIRLTVVYSATVPTPQRPKSTPDRNEEELGLHRLLSLDYICCHAAKLRLCALASTLLYK
jgi:hypothetical protein